MRVVRKIVKKRKVSGASTPKSDTASAPPTPSTLPYGPSRMPDEHQDGGWSQWRNYQEDLWGQWDWPPKGWRPEPHHRAYWDKSSPYYRYNTYDWDQQNGEKWDSPEQVSSTPSPKIRSPDSVTTLLQSQSTSDLSSVVRETADGLLRSSSIDQLNLEARLNEAANAAASNSSNAEPETAHEAEKKANKQNEKGQNKEGQNKEDQNKEGQNKEDQNKEGQNKEGQNKEGQNKEGQQDKEGQNKEGQKTEEAAPHPGQECQQAIKLSEKELKKIEERKKAAHARYMRYFRSVRSHALSFHCSRHKYKGNCMIAHTFSVLLIFWV